MIPQNPARASAPSYCVGIIHYKSYVDLETCLGAVAGQTLLPQAVRVVDADADTDALLKIRGRHPAVAFEAAANRGYSAAANRLLAWASGPEVGADFCLLLNPDVTLEADFGQRLVDALAARPDAALGAGKLMRPDRLTLDSAGIALPAHRRPRDRGSEQHDRGGYEAHKDVSG